MPNGRGSVYPFSEFLRPAAISGFWADWADWADWGFKGFRVLKALKVLKVFRKKYLLITLY